MIKIKKQRKKLNISLSGKVTALIILFMVFCAVAWTCIMFINMNRNAKENAMADEIAYMKTFETNANSVEEVCNLAKQIVSETHSILDYIKLTKKGEDLSAVEKIEFYNNEISAVDNMTNINPYLFQVRLFVNSDVVEKKPCFYKINRMKNMSWANNYKERKWQIDYRDRAFPDSVKETVRLAGIVSEIKDDSGELLAVLEVSTEIDSLFMNFNTISDEESCCFISDDGQIVAPEGEQESWENDKEAILEYINNHDNMNTSAEQSYNGQSCIVSVLDMGSMEGVFIHVRNTADTINSYYQSQIPYILVVLASTFVFILIVIILINNIFKRFNTLTATVRRIKNGEDVRLPEQGEDEISELGKQINGMLVTLDKLNRENTNKQLLVKNAEIKGLQNQINAHFMYNVLETIKMMAEIKEDYEISDAVTSLGDMFRYSVKWSSGMVELNEELKYIQNYLNLLNLRFDFEIFLSLNIPKKFQKIKIPKMSLQPLIENAVYHGIENMAEDTYIYIKVLEKDDIINIEVSDPGVGMDEKTLRELNEKLDLVEEVDEQADHGRALYNVQQRIKMYFGQEYGLQIFSKEGMYTKVLIQIPKDKEI